MLFPHAGGSGVGEELSPRRSCPGLGKAVSSPSLKGPGRGNFELGGLEVTPTSKKEDLYPLERGTLRHCQVACSYP